MNKYDYFLRHFSTRINSAALSAFISQSVSPFAVGYRRGVESVLLSLNQHFFSEYIGQLLLL